MPQYDVTADGQRFLMLSLADPPDDAGAARPRIVLVQNFFEVLRRLAAATVSS